MNKVHKYIDKASECVKDENEVFICLHARTDCAQNCLSYSGDRLSILSAYMTLGAALCEKLDFSYEELTNIMKKSVENVEKIMKGESDE